MAQFRKKRRGPQGPNKNELKVEQRMQDEARERRAGSIADHFPDVKGIAVAIRFMTPEGATLAEEKRVFKPSDAYKLDLACPGRCGTGTFDLAAKLEEVVTTRQTSVETGAVCAVQLYAGLADTCGCKLSCRIDATYND